MRDSSPPLLAKVGRKLRRLVIYPKFKKYLSGISHDHPLSGMPARLVADASANPTEWFDHYDAFAFWAADRIGSERRRKILDVGSVKMMNAMLSVYHDVTAIVLADCGDELSRVQYLRHDVADRLPFADKTFDVFTSSASLPLVGLGRYGDRLDPNCLPRLVAELDRVMAHGADLIISMCLGKSILNFNNGWFLDMPTIRRIFRGWHVIAALVDNQSSPNQTAEHQSPRFNADTSVDNIPLGDYRVVFLHLKRESAT